LRQGAEVSAQWKPDARVAAFLRNAGKGGVFLSVMTIGEICKGIALLPVE
jgi:hypothetical protein